MMLFDTHAHLLDERFDEDREELIGRLPLEGVESVSYTHLRKAETKDFKKVESNKKKEKEAFGVCVERIAKHKMDMKLIDVEYTFDSGKIIFYFTAEGRVDFRELVKDLSLIHI